MSEKLISKISVIDPIIINKILAGNSKELPNIDVLGRDRQKIRKMLINLPDKIGALNLCRSWIIDNDLIYLTGHDIEKLYLSRGSITNKGLQILSCCCHINKLKLDASRIDDQGLKYLSNIPQLIFTNGLNITDQGLKYLCLNEDITFIGCPRITDQGMNYLTNVRFIKIIDCDNITHNGLRNLNLNIFEIAHTTKHITNHKSINQSAAIISRVYGIYRIDAHDVMNLSNVKNIYFCGYYQYEFLKYLTNTDL